MSRFSYHTGRPESTCQKACVVGFGATIISGLTVWVMLFIYRFHWFEVNCQIYSNEDCHLNNGTIQVAFMEQNQTLISLAMVDMNRVECQSECCREEMQKQIPLYCTVSRYNWDHVDKVLSMSGERFYSEMFHISLFLLIVSVISIYYIVGVYLIYPRLARMYWEKELQRHLLASETNIFV